MRSIGSHLYGAASASQARVSQDHILASDTEQHLTCSGSEENTRKESRRKLQVFFSTGGGTGVILRAARPSSSNHLEVKVKLHMRGGKGGTFFKKKCREFFSSQVTLLLLLLFLLAQHCDIFCVKILIKTRCHAHTQRLSRLQHT